MSGGHWIEMFNAVYDGDLDLVEHHLKSGAAINYAHPEFLATPLAASVLLISKMIQPVQALAHAKSQRVQMMSQPEQAPRSRHFRRVFALFRLRGCLDSYARSSCFFDPNG